MVANYRIDSAGVGLLNAEDPTAEGPVSSTIPLVDLAAQQREIEADVQADLRVVFDRTCFIGGPDVGSFEDEYAQFVGVDHCVGVGNGTDAVEFALRALGLGPGSEVIIPANTFIATAEAVRRAGADPVFVDVDPETLLMDPARVEEAITSKTRAVVPVHIFGRLAPIEQIAKAAPGIPLVEDAAQSQGARTVEGRVSGIAWTHRRYQLLSRQEPGRGRGCGGGDNRRSGPR